MPEPKTKWDAIVNKFKNNSVGILILVLLAVLAAVKDVRDLALSLWPKNSATVKDVLDVSGLNFDDLILPFGVSDGAAVQKIEARIALSIQENAEGPLSIHSIEPACTDTSSSFTQDEERTVVVDDTPVMGTSTPDRYSVVFQPESTLAFRVDEDNSTIVLDSSNLLGSPKNTIIHLAANSDPQHFIDLSVVNLRFEPCDLQISFTADYLGERDDVIFGPYTILP